MEFKKITNLFNGNKELANSMIKILNENWMLLWDEVQGEFNKAFVNANEKFLKKVFSTVAYEDMFLPDE